MTHEKLTHETDPFEGIRSIIRKETEIAVREEFARRFLEAQTDDGYVLPGVVKKVKKAEIDKGKKFVSGRVVAETLGISLMTLLRRRDEGKIPAYRFGSRVLYNLEEVIAELKPTKQ